MAAVVVPLVLALLHAQAAAALPSAPDAGTWITDGPVYALAHAGGTTYVGGAFQHVGLRTGPGAPFGIAGDQAGRPLRPFPEVAGGRVRAVVADGQGGWYIGGDFTSVGGYDRAGLAYIDPSGNVGAFAPALACALNSAGCLKPTVLTLALAGDGPDAGTLYVGGTFEKVGNISRQYLAAFDTASGTLRLWNPAPDDWVRTLAVAELPLKKTVAGVTSDVKVPVVFAGGDFLNVAGVARTRLAGVWGFGAVDETGAGIGGQVSAWNPGGGDLGPRALALSPSVPLGGDSVALAVYVGGERPSSSSTQPLNAFRFSVPVAARNTSYSTYSGWNPSAGCAPAPLSGTTCGVRSLFLAGSTLYVAGTFRQIGAGTAQARNGIAAVSAIADPSATSVNAAGAYAWDPNANAAVNTVVSDGAHAYVGGDFSTLGGSPRSRLAALPAPADASTTDSAALWDAGLAGPGGADALALSGSTLYAGGGFDAAQALARGNLAAFDATGAPTGWAPSADASVRSLLVTGGVVYAGGEFTHLADPAQPDGLPRGHLGAIDAGGGILPWQADTDGWVFALSSAGDAIYAGGAFTTIAGQPRANVAALGAVGAVDAAAARPWKADANDAVLTIAASCGVVYLGGRFTEVAGATRAHAAAIDPESGAANAWNPDPDSTVNTLLPAGTVVYAGGRFAYAGGQTRHGAAALDRTTGVATSWNPDARSESIVRALGISGDGATIYAGGSFTTIGGEHRDRLAALTSDTGNATAWSQPADDSVYALVASGDNLYAAGEFAQVGSVMQQGFASFTGGSDAPDGTSPPCPYQARPVVVEPPPAPPAQVVEAIRQVKDRLAPLIRRFAMSRTRFRVGRKATALIARRRAPVGTAFLLRTSEAGTAVITIDRRLARAKHSRLRLAGSLRRAVRAGSNRIAFSGRLGKRALAPGQYIATVRVTDAAGNTSALKRVSFRVAA